MWVFKKYSYYDIFLIIIFKLFFKFNKIENEYLIEWKKKLKSLYKNK